MMDPKMLAELNQQIMEETYSAYIYHAMAADLEHKGYKGMATWMRVQAREEKIHADIFYNFILGRGVELEEKDPAEVAELKGVNVRNPYFEVVPGRLVTGMITEMGVMEPLDIRRRMEEMRKQVEPLYRTP